MLIKFVSSQLISTSSDKSSESQYNGMCIVPRGTRSVKMISTAFRYSVDWRIWLLSVDFLTSLIKITHIVRSNRPQVDHFIFPIL